MSLLANLNAFKNKVKAAPVSAPVKVGAKSSSSSSTPPQPHSAPTPKRRIDDDDDLEKQYKRPTVGSVSTTHLSTKLLQAVEYIKSKNVPLEVSDVFRYLNIMMEDERSKLLNLLIKLEKVQYDERAQTLEYVSIHNIKDKDDLLAFLRSQPTFKGISVKELKDGWDGCIDAIDDLEQEGKILVLRTKKDDKPRLVWANVGSELGLVDEEFVKHWQNVKLPEISELPGKLSKLGLKPASVDPATIKKDNSGNDIKKRKTRKGKITNTHMAGILKDYST